MPAASRPTGASRTGAATRLLILGCVRIFQPVHGYFLRRELLSWRVDEWANVHPGSIYHALRTLTASGQLDEVEAHAEGTRPTRTAYALTAAGEEEFQALLRDAFTELDDPVLFVVGMNFATNLPRAEVLELVTARGELIRDRIAYADEWVDQALESPEMPPATSEVLRIFGARLTGELVWLEDYLDRVAGGAYAFHGEPPDWAPSPELVAEQLRAGAGLRGLGAIHRPAPSASHPDA
ncbi:PadR family transcriptional regulator [Cellulomonas hominis]